MPRKQNKINTIIACSCRVANYGRIKERKLCNLPLSAGAVPCAVAEGVPQ